MGPDSNTADLVQLCRAGNAEAANLVFSLYAQRLSRLAEEHLSRRLASRIDEQDIVQSVFRTFFARVARGEFQIDSGGQLWRLLARITLMKVRAQARFHTAACRDISAEQDGAADDWLIAAVAREPDPQDAAALVEQIDHLLRDLPEFYAQVLEARLRGSKTSQIAAERSVSRQTVYRALGLLQERMILAEAGQSVANASAIPKNV